LRAPSVSPELRTIIVEEVAKAQRPEGVSIVQALVGNRSPDTHSDGATLAIALNTAEARSAIEGLLDSGDAALAQRVGFFLADYGSAIALGLVRDLALNPEMPEDLRLSALAVVRDRAPTTATFEQVLALTTETGRSLDFTLSAFTWLGALNSTEARDHLNALNNGLFADDRLRAITGLGYLQDGAPVADFIAILSGSGEQALRAAAARALGNVGTTECVQVLSQQLFMERDEVIKMAIIEAIATAGDASAATQLTYEFAAQNPVVTLAVLDALGKLGNTSVARTVEGLVTSAREPEVRWKATIVLTMLDPDAGRIRLLQAIERPPENFRDDIAGFSSELLNEIDETLLLNSSQAVREEALYRVLTRADGGYSVFRPLLDGGLSPEVRNTALSVVISRRNPADADLFVRLTEDPDRAVRMQATTALAELGLESQSTHFMDRLDHADFTLRLMAAYAVVNIYAGNDLVPPAPAAPAPDDAATDAEVPAP
jgi:HEAT repeat protein